MCFLFLNISNQIDVPYSVSCGILSFLILIYFRIEFSFHFEIFHFQWQRSLVVDGCGVGINIRLADEISY